MNSDNLTLILDNSVGKFYEKSIRDTETIFCLKDGQWFINYSYIVNKFNKNEYGFRNIIRSKHFLEDLIQYCKNNNIKFTREVTFESIPELLNEVNFFFNINRTNTKNITNEVQGTYGLTDFIDIILFNLSPEYRQEIHKLMKLIQQNSDLTNTSFMTTLQNIIDELQERIKELEQRNKNLNIRKEMYKNKFEYSNIVSKLKDNFHSKD